MEAFGFIELQSAGDGVESLVGHPSDISLVALYRNDQLTFHLGLALKNGLSVDELAEAITHLAFYAGWPNAMGAIPVLKAVLAEAATESAADISSERTPA